MNKPILISAGDISGINLYILLQTVKKFNFPFEIVLNQRILELYADFFSLEIPKNLKTIEIESIELNSIVLGKPNETINNISYLSLYNALSLLKKDYTSFAGFITLPVNKNEMAKIVPGFSGHTEFIAKFFNKNVNMLLYSEKISVCPITTHISLEKVNESINEELLRISIKNLKNFYRNYLNKDPQITVVCANPHCSDNGLLGNVDNKIKKIINKYSNIKNPIASDTAFTEDNIKNTDVFLCMYHDQALIPFKMLSFYDGINITIGLPFLRISPDHGPAYDKVKDVKNINCQSLENSIEFIIKKAP